MEMEIPPNALTRTRMSDCPQAVKPIFERVGWKSGIPVDFFKSQTEIHNFRTALARVVRQLRKSDGIRKSCPAFRKAGRKFEKSDRFLDFRLTLAKVVRNLKKSDNFWKSRTTFDKV